MPVAACRALRAALTAGALIIGLAGCGSSGSAGTGGSSSTATTPGQASTGQLSFEHVPLQYGPDLGAPGTTRTDDVDGISCGSTEQLVYHIHVRLQVYAHGVRRSLPAGIGIPGSQSVQSTEGPVAQGGQCIYWLHTHAPDGVIHVESPTQRVYTLGDFFDIWHQPLAGTRVANASGAVTAWVNGKRWSRDPRSIPLYPREVIQLDVGTPTPAFVPYSWAGTQL